ncbi:zinc finger CCCH domain-containing protein 14 [Plodia interpunctella]|uniref:zinc finger CCCH domain-containing protein 14 n=1 Tax=Plodia interpunctella TaxID=58824 RepID=UPI0023689E7F|nr:zinc finger CCCH domain-containing protein 14 [Plodia interpunctella]
MDDVGSEIGQKMRSAIKAKLTELGCYVDDELPDYVMVMVANKRTRAQMEDDLQLFLGDNTELFVNWLHQVLKKLQEVTVTTPLKPAEKEKSKERSISKDRKSKDKKDKSKKGETLKKSKKKEKEKEKSHKKKEDKKSHKSKKKSKHHEMIRPNVPPLLMNMEKESEPSITDVFAGQILKNHGISLDVLKDEMKVVDKKPILNELKRPIIPIIDPATITSQIEPDSSSQPAEVESAQEEPTPRTSVSSTSAPRDEQIKEINEIEAKIQGLKQKLAEQLDSMSDDEDFLNIRTEAEELMNDFAEDVFQEISSQAPVATPPLVHKSKSPTPPSKPIEVPKPKPIDPVEILPQIELKLPKRPVRERLGARDQKKVPEKKEASKRTESPERLTPEREPDFRPSKSAKSRLGDLPEKRTSLSDDSSSDKSESKRITSKVSVLANRPSRPSCASVVRVRPLVRPASSLLLRAVADAHKSLLNIPPKVDPEPQKVKRALVLPMRRCVDAQKIVIQVPGADIQTDNNSDNISLDVDSEDDKSSKVASETDKEEYVPAPITKKIINNEYVPSRRMEGRMSSRKDDTLIIETLNIHNPTIDKDKNTQFIVTMDGFNPNAFLAKKLMTEGLLNDEEELKTLKTKPKEKTSVLKTKEIDTEKVKEKPKESDKVEKSSPNQKKRVSDTSDESETQVIIKLQEKMKTDHKEEKENVVEKRKIDIKVEKDDSPTKRRKASPIVFDVDKKGKEKQKEERVEKTRERTESESSDKHVVVTTAVSSHKYDSLPPLSAADRKPAPAWCRSFPLCRYGSSCAFQHPRCKFLAACTRRGCLYSHSPTAPTSPAPQLASHVVPAANYKTITPTALPSICKYYPNCANPACHFYHPKPCRYGKACLNKLECNFYHSDLPISKYRYQV